MDPVVDGLNGFVWWPKGPSNIEACTVQDNRHLADSVEYRTVMPQQFKRHLDIIKDMRVAAQQILGIAAVSDTEERSSPPHRPTHDPTRAPDLLAPECADSPFGMGQSLKVIAGVIVLGSFVTETSLNPIMI